MWTLNDVIDWFVVRYQWSPSTVLEQSLGDLRRTCWRTREADRKRENEKDNA